jgi:hypothetical protein
MLISIITEISGSDNNPDFLPCAENHANHKNHIKISGSDNNPKKRCRYRYNINLC